MHILTRHNPKQIFMLIIPHHYRVILPCERIPMSTLHYCRIRSQIGWSVVLFSVTNTLNTVLKMCSQYYGQMLTGVSVY